MDAIRRRGTEAEAIGGQNGVTRTNLCPPRPSKDVDASLPLRRSAMAIRAIREWKGASTAGLVYGIKPEGFDYLKIGYCRDNYDRLKTLQVAWPVELEYVFVMPGDRNLETNIQSALWPSHIRGDWFHYDTLVKAFLDRLFADFPSAKPKAIPVEAKPVCDHVVRLGGYACEKCGLSKLLIPDPPLPDLTRPAPPTEEPHA